MKPISPCDLREQIMALIYRELGVVLSEATRDLLSGYTDHDSDVAASALQAMTYALHKRRDRKPSQENNK